ncbi:MAG TPA: urea ABC transporter substrate-binding protein, partial [Marinobacter hydrocarbonoclasticus]|nr:urea ABC transporter substrate-binding protein [Marinobacter nauticus]
MSIKKHVKLGLSALALSVSLGSINTAFAAEDPIKVGILHSLSGTMA